MGVRFLKSFRFKKEDIDKWKKAAESENRTLTNFIENCCNQALKKIKP